MAQKTETERELLSERERHPKAQPADYVKLLFQGEYGGGHLIENEDHSFACLSEEFSSVERNTSLPFFTLIGKAMARVNLSALPPDADLRVLNRAFVHTANETKGDLTNLTEKLGIFLKLASGGAFSFDENEAKNFVHSYLEKGDLNIHHSEQYRRLYAPAYRVIGTKYLPALPAIFREKAILAEKGRAVTAADGRAASGKSTFASIFSELTGAEILHMDDFFLPPNLRRHARLSEPGGNIHYERFITEVLTPLREGKPFTYGAFDCHREKTEEKRSAGKELIIEGAYALHPRFGDYADLKLFFDISPSLQRERIKKRNGEAMLKRFCEEWIPMENCYFDAFSIREKCDLIFEAES